MKHRYYGICLCDDCHLLPSVEVKVTWDDKPKDEVSRLKGIIRNLREIVWEHHSSDVMIPDVCPICTNRKMKWALDEADKALAQNA